MNEPVWARLREVVLVVHPTAFCAWVDGRGFKVYFLVGDCRCALTDSWATETMAWHDAAARLKAKIKV